MIAGILHRGGTTLQMSEGAVQKWGAGLSSCDCDTRESLLAALREPARNFLLVGCKHVDGELGCSSKETANLGAAFNAHEDERRLQTDRRKRTDGHADVGAAGAATGQNSDTCGEVSEEPPHSCRLEDGVHALNGRGASERHDMPPSPRVGEALRKVLRSRIGIR